MKKCSRCGTDIVTGQVACPHCGKPQRQPGRARCRYCGTVSSRSLTVCPGCGERLRHDWLRPLVYALAIVLGLALVLAVGPSLRQGIARFRPSGAVSTVQAMASDVPVLVAIPTLTPSLTPSVTPTPTTTPTTTPTPSLTPTPTSTPVPTETPTPLPTETPTPTATRARASRTPTSPPPTPTPLPTVVPPVLVEPEDEAPFDTQRAIIKLAWRGSYTLTQNDFYEVSLRWREAGSPATNLVYVQETFWFVPEALYLRADQETDRVYYWSVRLVHKEADAEGNEVVVPLSSASEEWAFYWR